MKKYFNRILAWVMILSTIIVFVVYSQNNYFIFNGDNSWRTRNFYREDKYSIDVALIGSSDVYTGYYPGVAYSEYGFTSYPFCIDGRSNVMWRSQLREVIRQQHPKLIVIDFSGAVYDDDEKLLDDGIFREHIDNIPLSIDKIKSLSESQLKEEYLSYCFPLIKYRGDFHNAIEAHKEKTFFDSLGVSKTKGIGTISLIDKRKSHNPKITDKKALNKNAEKYLLLFLDYCKNNHINNIVFVRFPEKYIGAEALDEIRRCNTAKGIISSYGYDVIDFTYCYDEIGIDEEKDFYNGQHMNVYGAVKFTKYFGGIISQKYGIKPSKLSETQKNNWNETVIYTNAFVDLSKNLIEKGEEKVLGENKETFELIKKETN